MKARAVRIVGIGVPTRSEWILETWYWGPAERGATGPGAATGSWRARWQDPRAGVLGEVAAAMVAWRQQGAGPCGWRTEHPSDPASCDRSRREDEDRMKRNAETVTRLSKELVHPLFILIYVLFLPFGLCILLYYFFTTQ
jgi:hypothetical protein